MRSPLRVERPTDRFENPARLEAFSDGVFSVAITLLVIDLHVPDFSHEPSSAQMWTALEALGPKFLAFAVSFVMIGYFWVGHHLLFWLIERSNRILMWLNLAFLFPIVCLPFATSLVGEYPHVGAAALVYVGITLIAAMTLATVWLYASRNGLVAEKLSDELVRATNRRLLIVITVMVSAGVLAPFFPQFAILAMMGAILWIVATTGSRSLVD